MPPIWRLKWYCDPDSLELLTCADIIPPQSYRAEQFRRAAEIYERLSQDKADFSHEENDLSINSWATDAQLQWKGEAEYVRHERPSREDLEAFETAYNAACFNIAKGELAQGEVLLNRAKSRVSAGYLMGSMLSRGVIQIFARHQRNSLPRIKLPSYCRLLCSICMS